MWRAIRAVAIAAGALVVAGCAASGPALLGGVEVYQLAVASNQNELCRLADEFFVGTPPPCAKLAAFATFFPENVLPCRIYIKLPPVHMDDALFSDFAEFGADVWHEIRHCKEGAFHENYYN